MFFCVDDFKSNVLFLNSTTNLEDTNVHISYELKYGPLCRHLVICMQVILKSQDTNPSNLLSKCVLFLVWVALQTSKSK